MPCCGPKAAVRLISGKAAKASNAWVKSAVTEAGCASNAMRLPAKGLRSSTDSSKRSKPNLSIVIVLYP